MKNIIAAVNVFISSQNAFGEWHKIIILDKNNCVSFSYISKSDRINNTRVNYYLMV